MCPRFYWCISFFTCIYVLYYNSCVLLYISVPVSTTTNLDNTSIQDGRNISYFVATETQNDIARPVLNWFYNSVAIDDEADRLNVFQNVSGLSSLVIKDSRYTDNGEYSLEGSNAVNPINFSSQLQVVNTGLCVVHVHVYMYSTCTVHVYNNYIVCN